MSFLWVRVSGLGAKVLVEAKKRGLVTRMRAGSDRLVNIQSATVTLDAQASYEARATVGLESLRC